MQEAAQPAIVHPDFNMRNIFVSKDDPTVITGIIDWQSTSAEPAFMFAHQEPDFAANPEIPDYETGAATGAAETSTTIEKQAFTDRAICYQAFDTLIKAKSSTLSRPRMMIETMFRPFRHLPLLHYYGAAAIRQDMIDIAQEWDFLQVPGNCPYTPGIEELNRHKQEFDAYQDAQKLKRFLMQLFGIASDGWVQADRWEQVKVDYKEAFRLHMEEFRNSENAGDLRATEEQGRLLWPWHDEELTG